MSNRTRCSSVVVTAVSFLYFLMTTVCAAHKQLNYSKSNGNHLNWWVVVSGRNMELLAVRMIEMRKINKHQRFLPKNLKEVIPVYVVTISGNSYYKSKRTASTTSSVWKEQRNQSHSQKIKKEYQRRRTKQWFSKQSYYLKKIKKKVRWAAIPGTPTKFFSLIIHHINIEPYT